MNTLGLELKMPALKTPLPPLRIKINFDKINKVMSEVLNKQPSVKSFYEDGEICVCRQGVHELYIFINRGQLPVMEHYDKKNLDCYAHLERTNVITVPYAIFANDGLLFIPGNGYAVRSATPEEKQLFLDELNKGGFRWDEENKKVVRNYWKPKLGEGFYVPVYALGRGFSLFSSFGSSWNGEDYELVIYERGWAFQTKEECDAFCGRINEAIQSVKRE